MITSDIEFYMKILNHEVETNPREILEVVKKVLKQEPRENVFSLEDYLQFCVELADYLPV